VLAVAGAVKAHCVSLWIGDALGPVERACLRSVVRKGHPLSLYCYGPVAGVPERVEVRDASEIIPEEAIFRQPSGSVGHFADWFRYEVQKRGLGTWIDTDLYLLAPLDGDSPFLFGQQQPGVVNNGVLRLPQDSPVIAELLRPFEEGTTPTWLPWRTYIRARWRQLLSGKADFGRLPWGSTGPYALTPLIRKAGLLSEALPPDVFYPVPWQRAGWILDPDLKLERMVTRRTIAIHLWNECIRGFKDEPAPEGSFLQRLHREGE
jgi:hypothetical protein